MNLRPFAFACLFAACTATAATAADEPDTAARRVSDALELKARIEHTVAEKLASAPAPEAPAAGAHAAAAAAGAAPVNPAAAPQAGAAPATPAAETDEWADLLAGNRRFVAGRPRLRTLVADRSALVAGQHPRAVILACADSRVAPELLFDTTLGELFVVRVAGNVVDSTGLGSIEYAIEHLHTGLVVVLGHTGCGAVTAAVAGGDPGSPNLAALVAHIAPVVAKLSNCFEGPELVERSVTANARRGAQELLENSAMLRHAQEAGELKVVAAVYELDTGAVKELR